jgi:hypothetical protein
MPCNQTVISQEAIATLIRMRNVWVNMVFGVLLLRHKVIDLQRSPDRGWGQAILVGDSAKDVQAATAIRNASHHGTLRNRADR